jgi:Flp pilus assembly protein TadD
MKHYLFLVIILVSQNLWAVETKGETEEKLKALRGEAKNLMSSGQYYQAAQTFFKILALDPADLSARGAINLMAKKAEDCEHPFGK